MTTSTPKPTYKEPSEYLIEARKQTETIRILIIRSEHAMNAEPDDTVDILEKFYEDVKKLLD